MARIELLDPTKRWMVEVRSFYHVLSSLLASPFLWKSTWRNKAPLRVMFFVLMTALAKILMLYNLRKRHAKLTDWCCICGVGNILTIFCFIILVFLGHMPQRVMERSGCKPLHFRNLEVGSSLFNMVCLEGTQYL